MFAAVELVDLVAVPLLDVVDHVGLADGAEVAVLALLGRGHLQVDDVDVVGEVDAAGGGEGAELADLGGEWIGGLFETYILVIFASLRPFNLG